MRFKYEGHDKRIEQVLCQNGAKTSRKLFLPFDPYWQKKKKDTLMIVSSLMATMAFQVGVNPPGGVWQDTSSSGDPLPHHVAGKAITATYYPNAYNYFMYFNTVGFLLSLTTILELIVVFPAKQKVFGFIGAGISWLAIMTMAFAYTFSIIVVSPSEEYKSVRLAILVTVIVWAVGISLLHVAPYVVQEILANVIEKAVLWLAFRSVFWLAQNLSYLVVCWFHLCHCWSCSWEEPASGNNASEETVLSPSNTASTADPKAVGEENDAGV